MYTGKKAGGMTHSAPHALAAYMKRNWGIFAMLTLMSFSTPSANAQGPLAGGWAIKLPPDTDVAQMTLSRPGGSGEDNQHFRVSLSRLQGLTKEQAARRDAPVEFLLRREAGTFNFGGSFTDGKGSGRFAFTPDPAFAARLREQGLGDLSPEGQLTLAVRDIDLELIQSLKSRSGDALTLEQLTRMARQGVGSDLARELEEMGYETPTARQLSDMATYAVRVEFIRELEALGYARPPLDEVIGLRRQAVGADFIREVLASGAGRPTLAEVIRMRKLNVAPAYRKQIEALGYTGLSHAQIINLSANGVTPDYMREIESFGYRGLTPEQFICLRIHDVTPEFIRETRAAGRGNVSLREMARLRNPTGTFQGDCALESFPDDLPK